MKPNPMTKLVLAMTLASLAPAQDGARESAVTRQLDTLVRAGTATQQSRSNDDAVTRLVRILDEGESHEWATPESSKPGTPDHARAQLARLGPLAHETIYRTLPSLGPFGIKACLGLLAASPDDRFAQLLESYLRSNDLGKQVCAAERLRVVPLERARDLVPLALAAKSDLVRAHGIAAAASVGMDAKGFGDELVALLCSTDKTVRDAALAAGSGRSLQGAAGLEVLKRLAQRGDDGTLGTMTRLWVATLAPDGEELVLELRARLAAFPATRLQLAQVVIQNRPEWAKAIAACIADAESALVPEALRILATKKIALPVATLDALIQRPGIGTAALAAYLQDAPLDPSHAAAFERWIPQAPHLNPDPRLLKGFAQADPERFLAFATRIMDKPIDQLCQAVAAQLAEDGRKEAVPLLCKFVREAPQRIVVDQRVLQEATRVIVERSDPSMLEAVLGSPLRAAQALERWFTHEQIPQLVGDIWWRLPSSNWTWLMTLVGKHATPAEAGALVALWRESDRRARATSFERGGQPDFTTQTAEWVRRLLARLDGAQLQAALRPLVFATDGSTSAEASKLLLALPSTDRRAFVATALDGKWNATLASELARMGEVLNDEALAQRFLDWNEPAGFEELDWASFFEQLSPAFRSKLALAQVERQAKAPRRANVLSVVLGALDPRTTPDFAATMTRFVRHPTPTVRATAVRQLANLCDRSAVPGLLEAMKLGDDDISALAERGLARLEKVVAAEARWQELLRK